MAKITITAVVFDIVPSAATNVLFRYRVSGAGTWINLNGGAHVVVPVSGTLTTPIEISGLTPNITYEVGAQTDCGTSLFTKLATTPESKIWIADETNCEQDATLFTVILEIGSFSSPALINYDTTSGRCYVADLDDPAGNFYWFDPATFALRTDVHYIAGSNCTIYAVEKDTAYRRMFGAGLDTNGLKILDIATNTISTYVYGTNSPYSRLGITILDTTIILYDQASATLTILQRDTLALLSTIAISSIASGSTFFEGGFKITQVGSELWITALQRYNGDIAVYNLALSTYIRTITLTGKASVGGWGSSRHWQTSFYDQVNNKFYAYDTGSNKLFIIDTITSTIISTRTITNRQGKPYSTCVFTMNTVTGELYLGYSGLTAPTDGAQIRRMYKINRTSFVIEIVFMNEYFENLVLQEGTTILWGGAIGLTSWLGGAWNTDGKIIKYSH